MQAGTRAQKRANAFLVSAILMVCCSAGFALNPSLDISQYAHKSWTVREGFFKVRLNAIAQTPDGYLLLGTEFGLYRFDGVRSVPWEPPGRTALPSNLIRKLFVARDGTLWIGTQKGLAKWKDGNLTLYRELPADAVDSIAEDTEQTIWVGVEDIPAWRLCAVGKKAVQCFGNNGTLGLGKGSLLSDKEGKLWAGTATGLWRWRPDSPESISLSGSASEIHDLIEDNTGAVLAATRGGIIKVVDRHASAYPVPDCGSQINPFSLRRDRDGGLWIGTKQGLLHVHQGRVDRFGKADGLSSDSIADLFEDREGNIWVATASGLDSFHEFAVATMGDRQGFSAASVESLLIASDGSVWLGTREGLDRWQDGRLTLYRKRRAKLPATVRQIVDSGLPDDFQGALFEDHRRQIWTFSLEGAAHVDERGRFTRVPNLPGGFTHSVVEDSAGEVWISQDQGMFHLLGSGKVEQIPWAKSGGRGLAFSLASDRLRGGIWLGFTQGGVIYYKDSQPRQAYTSADGLGQGRVNKLEVDQDGTLWAATEGGLSRLKSGTIYTLTSQNGLPCSSVHNFVEDKIQSVWLHTDCGLLRIARSDLEAWINDPKYVIKPTLFDGDDGLTPVAVPRSSLSPRMATSTDGKIWLVSGDGVSIIDPQHLPFNHLPPPVHIERITADEKTYDGPNGLRLPPHVHDLAIDYTALSLVAPEKMQFRVKLEGQDNDWRVPVNTRHAHYTNLSPKHYRFHVIACNDSGVWNEEGATLDFLIPPAWYQTNWFQAACAAAFLAMIWGVYEVRVRQMAAQFNIRLEERLAERTRIARDLHDTLLQSFQGLVFRFQAARYQLPDCLEEASETLDSALVSADQAIAEGRSAIQELRSGLLKQSSLEQMLLATGRELASSQNGDDGAPNIRVIVEGKRRAKRPMIKEEIYRIARELLRNAFRHARARNIETELRYDDDAFLLIVRDDGKGIDSTVLKDRGRTGHWGLPGMYERAEGIGARLDIWSVAAAGTEVRLRVPAAIAYATPSDSRSFRLFRRKTSGNGSTKLPQ